MFIVNLNFSDIIYLLIIILFFVTNLIKIRINLKLASIIFTLFASVILFISSYNNLLIYNSDFSLYCRIAIHDLFQPEPNWIYRELLFWKLLNFYNVYLFSNNCNFSFVFYMIPFFYGFFFYTSKISKLFFDNKDKLISLSAIPFVLAMVSNLYVYQNLLRNGAAFAPLMAAFYFFLTKKYFKSSLACLVGILIHNSIIIFVPLIIIFKYKKNLGILSFFITTLIYVFLSYSLEQIMESMGKGLGSDTYATSLIYFVLLTYWLFLPWLIKFSIPSSKLKLRLKELDYFVRLVLLSLIPFLIFSFNPLVFLRLILYYYALITPIIIGTIDLDFKKNFQSNLVLFPVMLPSIFNILT